MTRQVPMHCSAATSGPKIAHFSYGRKRTLHAGAARGDADEWGVPAPGERQPLHLTPRSPCRPARRAGCAAGHQQPPPPAERVPGCRWQVCRVHLSMLSAFGALYLSVTSSGLHFLHLHTCMLQLQ